MSPADNTPDFEQMSQDEIMAWLETLAKRQGATEGFTTEADVEVAEIDPSTVTIDEPGYVPYGQEAPKPPASTMPARATETQEQPAARREPEPDSEPTDSESLAWLESLAADQSEDLFNLDLSSLPQDVSAEAPAPERVDPMAWLDNRARAPGELQTTPAASGGTRPEQVETSDPYTSGIDPMEWLESLARRQGADSEELITPARMDIPTPQETEVEEPGYTAFSFDTPPVSSRAAASTLEDPAEFLSSLAATEGYDESGVRATQKSAEMPEVDLSDEAIQEAINSGTVTREQMQVFLERETDRFADEDDDDDVMPLVEDDEDEQLVPADIPDWLLEQIGAPPSAEEAETPSDLSNLEALFSQTPPAETMPDWLQEEALEAQNEINFDDLFGDESPETEPEGEPEDVPSFAFEADANDPWAEAFDLEADQGMPDTDAVPEWYERNLNDPQRVAEVEALETQAGADVEPVLLTADFPAETSLPPGQPQAMPGWLAPSGVPFESETTPVPQAGTAAAEALPDWLSGLDEPVSTQEIPDWLVETIDAEADEPAFIPTTQVEPEDQPEPEPLPLTTPEPAPVERPAAVSAPQTVAATPEVSEALERARDREQSGDLEGSLAEYETLIRSNAGLEAVVTDLSQLVQSYRTVPAVYRVLGDGLMRQGKLQEALNTYRQALNQL